MARLFLTNIDLNQNELQNAVIQNLSTAPSSGNTEGRIYYDSTRKTLRVWRNDSIQGAKWYDLSVGGASASTVTLTGDVTGTANVDPTTGIITVNTHFNVSGTANQIAVNDIENTTTISLTDSVDINTGLTIGGTNTEADGYIHLVDAAGDRYASLEDNGGNLRITSNSGLIETNESEIAVQKTSYWRNETQQGVIAAQSDSSLRVTAITGQLQLESNSGDVRINPNSTVTWFNNNIYINADSGIIGTDVNSLHLNADNGVITTDTAEFHTPKIELWNGGDTSGSRLGVVLAHPSDGSLTIAASNQLNLEAHSGGINLDPQNGQTTFSNEVRIDSEGVISTNNTDLTLSPDSGNVVINNVLVTDSVSSKNSGQDTLYIGGGYSNINLNGDNGNIELNPDGQVVVAGNAQFNNDVTISGNLNVEGTLNAVNRTEINIEDNTIRLNTGFTGSPTADAGIIVERGTANDTAIIWSESNDQWTLTNDGSHYYAIARKYVEVVGDASNTSFDVVHNLGTRDITVMVRENNAEYNVVETDVLMKDGNTVTIGFTDAPALNAYKVIIVG